MEKTTKNAIDKRKKTRGKCRTWETVPVNYNGSQSIKWIQNSAPKFSCCSNGNNYRLQIYSVFSCLTKAYGIPWRMKKRMKIKPE